MNLKDYKNIIDHKPIHIATVNKDNNPNLAVAADVEVIDDDKIIISVNEMVNTQENIKYNPNVVITAFDEEFKGVRIFGTAEYFEDGEYYDFCEKNFFGNGQVTSFGATKPKGAIVVTVTNCFEYV